ncbi:MAG: hypothetical protein ACLS5C_06300 [Waltera sp.]
MARKRSRDGQKTSTGIKAFYQGNEEAEQNLMEQTTTFLAKSAPDRKRLQQRELTVDMEMQEPARLADMMALEGWL